MGRAWVGAACRSIGFAILVGPLLATCAYLPDDASRAHLTTKGNPQPSPTNSATSFASSRSDRDLVVTTDHATRAEATTAGVSHSSRKAAATTPDGHVIGNSLPSASSPDGVTASTDDDAIEALSASPEGSAPEDHALSKAPTTAPAPVEPVPQGPETRNGVVAPFVRYGVWSLPLLLAIFVLIRMMKRRSPRRHDLSRSQPSFDDIPAAKMHEDLPKQVFDALPVEPSEPPPPEPSTRLTWSNEQPSFSQWEGWYFNIPVDVSSRQIPFQLQQDRAKECAPRWIAPAVFEPQITVTEYSADSEATPEPALPETLVDLSPAAITKAESATPTTLLDRLEQIAISTGDSLPFFFIELNGPLPTIACTAHLPSTMLDALETVLLEAVQQCESSATWLLVQLLMMRMAHAGKADIDSLYTQAFALAQSAMASADHDQRIHWQARLIGIDLASVTRQKGAARLLSLRTLQARYASDIQLGEGPVLQAWIDVLLYWAHGQLGDSALGKYAEAEAVCQRLQPLPGYADDAQRLYVKVLVHRAAVEQGGIRAKSLDTAQTLIDALFARLPTAEIALAVATTSLARGQALSAEQAKEAYSHALMHAFIAESDPRWRADGLQCRLAIQLAYEALPNTPIQGQVALDLSHRLEALSVARPETLQCMAQVYLRHADFARACQLCEEAWRSGTTPAAALMATWQEASKRWADSLSSPSYRAAWEQSERQRRIASLRH
ncbi:hypothetical protein [Dyella subtropica]|uniref:hypothetical protein n=1 Tax=Dyella subtropica TaxID=2992127 RepID=UPI00224E34AD|nr:hypothetical protein [Dyella subtropica]